MRYVCQTCGEVETWKRGATDKTVSALPRIVSETDLSDGSSETEWAAQAGPSGSHSIYNPAGPRNGSTSTITTRGSLISANANVVSPTGAVYRPAVGPTPPDSPTFAAADQLRSTQAQASGYELCAGCIEVHGVAHSREAAGANGMGRRRPRQLRHTFREKIWGVEGWTDVGE